MDADATVKLQWVRTALSLKLLSQQFGVNKTVYLLIIGNDLVMYINVIVFRTATSWIREGRKSLCGRERRQTKLKDKLLWPELWWVTLHQNCTCNFSLCSIALACCIYTPYFLRTGRYYCSIVVLNWQLGVFPLFFSDWLS